MPFDFFRSIGLKCCADIAQAQASMRCNAHNASITVPDPEAVVVEYSWYAPSVILYICTV